MNFLTAIILSLSIISPSFAGGEMKEVCKDVIKKGKTIQECKKIKVHKKVEGTQVPDSSKKK